MKQVGLIAPGFQYLGWWKHDPITVHTTSLRIYIHWCDKIICLQLCIFCPGLCLKSLPFTSFDPAARRSCDFLQLRILGIPDRRVYINTTRYSYVMMGNDPKWCDSQTWVMLNTFYDASSWPELEHCARNQHDKLTWEEGEWAGESIPVWSSAKHRQFFKGPTHREPNGGYDQVSRAWLESMVGIPIHRPYAICFDNTGHDCGPFYWRISRDYSCSVPMCQQLCQGRLDVDWMWWLGVFSMICMRAAATRGIWCEERIISTTVLFEKQKAPHECWRSCLRSGWNTVEEVFSTEDQLVYPL